jgi:hypothetical protein
MKIKSLNSINAEIRAYLERVYGKPLPEIVDAKRPLRMQPIKADCDDAEPKNPFNCVLVHCAARMFGSRAAIFWKGTAYVDLISPEDNVRRIERFMVNQKAFQHIRDLDTGKPFREGTAIVLDAPTPSKTLESVRQANKRYHDSPRGKLVGRLTVARSAKRTAEARYDRAVIDFETAQERHSATSPIIAQAKEQRKIAREALQKARETEAALADRVDAKRTRSGKPRPRNGRKFDITTRNGAAGHYNIVQA